MQILFLKAHNKGYTKKDGTYVAPFDDKRLKKAPPAKTPFQHGLFGFSSGFGASPYGGEGAGPRALFGGFSKPKGLVHPERGDKGEKIYISNPSVASGSDTWGDAGAVAVWTPGSAVPAELHGVAFAPWDDHPRSVEAWDYVEGQMDDLDEPPMYVPPGKEASAGVIVEEPDGRVWVVHPTNSFAGYKSTFPKGHADYGLSLQASAIKEAFEESGLKVEITGFVADIPRTQTVCRYYRARRVGGSPAAMGWESQAVALVPKSNVTDYMNTALDRSVSRAAGYGGGDVENIDDWTVTGEQLGSNDGGFFEDAGGVEWYCKFPASENSARNEVLACKLYAALGVEVPEVKFVEHEGNFGIASRVVAGVKQDKLAVTSGKLPGVNDGFAADCWLANWDVAGMGFDNLLVKDGRAVRIDAGGALVYRAQGAPKGDAFGTTVGEVDSLRSGVNPWSKAVFSSVSDADIRAGVAKIAALPETTIRALCAKYGPGSPSARAKLADKLLARRADLEKRFLGK